MPSYDFECSCGYKFEEFHRMDKAPKTRKCPECGKRAKRLISAGGGIIFKGSGFYENDYRKNENLARKTRENLGKTNVEDVE